MTATEGFASVGAAVVIDGADGFFNIERNSAEEILLSPEAALVVLEVAAEAKLSEGEKGKEIN